MTRLLLSCCQHSRVLLFLLSHGKKGLNLVLKMCPFKEKLTKELVACQWERVWFESHTRCSPDLHSVSLWQDPMASREETMSSEEYDANALDPPLSTYHLSRFRQRHSFHHTFIITPTDKTFPPQLRNTWSKLSTKREKTSLFTLDFYEHLLGLVHFLCHLA